MQEDAHTANGRDTGAEQLCTAVKDAISRSEPIRASSIDSIWVHVSGKRVILTGVVATDAQKWVAAQLARAVPGVEAVDNNLQTSEDLEREIARALGSDETTRHLRLGVRVAGAAATLYGAVSSQAEADAALAVASKVDDVTAVRSSMQLLPPGEAVIVLEQHSLEGREMAGAGLKKASSTTEAVPDVDAPAPSSDATPGAPVESIA